MVKALEMNLYMSTVRLEGACVKWLLPRGEHQAETGQERQLDFQGRPSHSLGTPLSIQKFISIP